MTRKSVRRRPELESLESIALLSGISTVAHPGVAALVDHLPQARKSIPLSGTVKGTFKNATSPTAPITFSAKGSVKGLGQVTATGSLYFDNVSIPYGTMTLTTSHGKISVKLKEKAYSGPFIMTINGGTTAYLGASGTGSSNVTMNYMKRSFSLKFTATLVCLHC
jgi:hypothetical protein